MTPIEQYIAKQPEAIQPVLERVHGAIRKALPEAEEVISYGMPAFRQHGRVVIYFAGWKAHYSIYPATGGLVDAFAEELAGYEISKGTIRFPLSQPVPVRLVGKLAKFRASIAAELEAAKKKKKKSS